MQASNKGTPPISKLQVLTLNQSLFY